ncbi:hypothetical protein AMK77_24280 [Escherichia coli]|nr:hypothetical protein AKK22_01620 [Escherichia coli]EYY46223.1 hypothetical protein BX81_02225 [Escherichia coli O165:H25 str. 2010C-4874]KHJ29983.1 hypothetical protein PU04_00755 [Escherichia coli]KLH02859.1 hypothetical protein WQ88_21115 [Escherichia coli]KYV40212.1 hypothetical protein AMK77_24280 [Escherichia coli]
MLTGKYCEHLPLYRQSEIFARQGVELSRALLSNWVDACCQLMTPLNDALYRYVMNTRKLHTDDTPVKVLAPGLKKTKTGRIWTYVRDDRNAGSSSPPAVWFAYSPNRQGKHPEQHLRGRATIAPFVTETIPGNKFLFVRIFSCWCCMFSPYSGLRDDGVYLCQKVSVMKFTSEGKRF